MLVEYISSVPSFIVLTVREEREENCHLTSKARYSDTTRPIIYQHRYGVTGLYQIPNRIHTLLNSYITTHTLELVFSK